jgi:hypothetical protein
VLNDEEEKFPPTNTNFWYFDNGSHDATPGRRGECTGIVFSLSPHTGGGLLVATVWRKVTLFLIAKCQLPCHVPVHLLDGKSSQLADIIHSE